MTGKVAYVPYAAIVPPVTVIKLVIAIGVRPWSSVVTWATFTMVNLRSLPTPGPARPGNLET
jgi:hypothetical protein